VRRADRQPGVLRRRRDFRAGRLRYFALPHSLQDINGRFLFDAQGIRIVDAAAQLGGGPVKFGGRIG
jgi:hypothetical protein